MPPEQGVADPTTRSPSAKAETQTHRGVLALQAGAVEAQGGDAGRAPREVEQALIAPLARLRLRQVPGGQGDGLHHTHRHVDLGGGQDLRAVLGDKASAEPGWRLAGGLRGARAPPRQEPCAHFTRRHTEDVDDGQPGPGSGLHTVSWAGPPRGPSALPQGPRTPPEGPHLEAAERSLRQKQEQALSWGPGE